MRFSGHFRKKKSYETQKTNGSAGFSRPPAFKTYLNQEKPIGLQAL
jgi:hypothetical protein